MSVKPAICKLVLMTSLAYIIGQFQKKKCEFNIKLFFHIQETTALMKRRI